MSALLLSMAALTSVAMAQTEPVPPLTRDQVLDMVSVGVNSVDILVEAKARRLDFMLDAEVLKQLEESGADPLLLNTLGIYSIEIQSLLLDNFTYLREKSYRRVIDTSTEILKKSPRLVIAYLIRGSAHRAQSNSQAAVEDFRTAIQYHPNDCRARVLLSESLIAQDKIEDAIHELTWVLNHRSVAATLDWPTAHRLLAQAYLQRRDYKLASQHLHSALWQLPFPNPEAVELLPELEDHMSVLARLLALCPDPEIASPTAAVEIAHLMKMMASNESQQQTALLRLAEGQAALGQFDAAIVTQQAAQIISSGPASESMRERLEVYRQQQIPWMPAAESAPPSSSPFPVKSLAKAILKKMVRVEHDSAGETAANSSENPGTISPFWIGKYEVTREEWNSVMGASSIVTTPDLPVEQVSWDDCQNFLSRLNENLEPSAPRFRLPTTREWKSAAQAKATTRFYFGDDTALMGEHGWLADHSHGTLHAVGQLRENSLGLFDVYGNVAEWCEDPASATTPKSAGTLRRFIGGSYMNRLLELSPDMVGFARQNEARRGLGFRLAADGQLNEVQFSEPELVPSDATKQHRPAGINRAIEHVRQTLESEFFQRTWLQEKLFTLLYLQACVRNSQNDTDTAIANLRSLIRELPDDSLPMTHLTRCHLAWILATREGATPEHIQEARKLVETTLTRAEFKLWIGYLTFSAVLAAEGDQDGAVRRATQAEDQAPVAFKPLCTVQLKALREKQISSSRQFPVPPSIAPVAVVEQ
jgi:formylglycine-generating enzyme required for sulfatase activity